MVLFFTPPSFLSNNGESSISNHVIGHVEQIAEMHNTSRTCVTNKWIKTIQINVFLL